MSPSAGNVDTDIARHYTHGSLLQTILNALAAAGMDPAHLAADDLSTFDEFHIGGRAATIELADQMGVAPGMRLLDVGSGIGGPARYFAAHRECSVTGIDLSAEYCETAIELSARSGLGERTQYREASAASLPFDGAEFDGAYMIHVGMNLPAKRDVFRDVARVVKPGGIFAIFDIMRQGAGELAFPLPWANAANTSFVETTAGYVESLREAGFEIEKQRSRTDFAIEFFKKMMAAAAAGPPPLGLSLVMGPTAPLKIGNLKRLVEQGILAPVEIVCRKR
jgi:ubiquinone/menaquinone biosynthesis C-methylase UbiE